MNCLVVILGHGAIQATFDRHLHLWESHRCPILVNSPCDDPIRTSHSTYESGLSAHNGDAAYWRFRNIICHMASMVWYDQFLLMEYDCFMLDPVIRPLRGVRAVMADNLEQRFQESRFGIPPMQMDGETLRRIAAEASKDEGPHSFGFLDRIISRWVSQAKVGPMFAWEPTGIAIAKIEIEHLDYMRKAIMRGVTAVHGVKDQFILDLVLKWRAEYIAQRSQTSPASSGKPGARRQ